MKVLLVLTLFFFSLSISFGQLKEKYRFNQIELSKVGVETAQKSHWDEQGLVWFQTNNGLVRFDGYRTLKIENVFKEQILPEFEISKIHSISPNEFWISYVNQKIITRIHTSSLEFQHFELDELEKDSSNCYHITRIKRDSKNRLWLLIYEYGLLLLNEENSKTKSYNFPDTSFTDSSFYITDFAELKDGRFLVTSFLQRAGARAHPVYFDPQSWSHEPFGIPEYLDKTDNSNLKHVIQQHMRIINFVHVDQNDKYWFGTYSGLLYCDPLKMEIRRISGNGVETSENLENAKTHLALGPQLGVGTTNQGVMLVNTNTFRIQYIQNDPFDPYSLRDNRIIDLSIDPLGNIWMLNKGTAISTHSWIHQQFKIHPWNSIDLDYNNRSLQTIPVNKILVRESGSVLISNGNGLVEYFPKKRSFKNLNAHIQKTGRMPKNIPVSREWGDSIICVNGDHIYFFEPKTGKKSLLTSEESSHFSSLLFWHLKHKDQLIAFKQNKKSGLHIVQYNFTTNRFETLVNHKYEKYGFNPTTQFSWILPSKNWLVSIFSGKFAIINHENYKVKLFSPKEGDYFFPDSSVNCAYVNDQNVWIGSGTGLYLFNEENEEFKSYSDSIQLGDSEGVYAIIQDESKNYWIALKDQLVRWNRKTGEVDRFNKDFGLNIGEFLPAIAQSDSSGFLYFATRNGILCFHPKRIRIPKKKPQIFIADIRVNGELIELNEKLQLPYNENNIELDFYTNQVYALKPHIFYYRYKGDDTWTNIGTSNKIKLRDLKEGHYTIEVKVINGYGKESEIFEFKFEIFPPFWKTWWFISMLIVLIGLLIFAWIKYRERSLRKKSEVLERTVEERTKEVVEQKDIVEEKNKEILDSINYAKRIQNAILPPEPLIKEHLPNSFVLYKPKDIVAGDFYWLEVVTSAENQVTSEDLVPRSSSPSTVLIAAADCTGHGVPGAMVSVICNNGLNRSVREYGLNDPGQILNKTRELVVEEFQKSTEEVKDGMDIALVSLEQVQEERDSVALNSCSKLKYAGAHNPLWIIRKGSNEIEEVKADKQPIGQFDDPQPYKTHEVQLKQGDQFYIFTDGYADQFGGEKGKKLKSKNFKKVLISLKDKSMDKQKEELDVFIENWRADNEQLDDICVIGIRL